MRVGIVLSYVYNSWIGGQLTAFNTDEPDKHTGVNPDCCDQETGDVMMNEQQKMVQLVEAMSNALREYDRLALYEEEHTLGEPCTASQLQALERIVGKSLPPSYRAFMALHNGWDGFSGDAKVLSVVDHGSEWLKNRLDELSELYPAGKDPVEVGMIPILLGEDAGNCLFLDPNVVDANGEMEFVSFDLGHEEDRFPSFAAFLQHELDVTLRLIDREVKGTADEDEES